MSFSMDQIKNNRNKKVKYVNTTELFSWSHNLENISDSAKLAIRLYLDARLFIFGPNGLSKEMYKYLIKDLLKNCCGKEFIDIVPRDTDLNIDDIVFQLKWAIERHRKDKRTLYKKTIYVNRTIEIKLRKYDDNQVPKRKKFENNLTLKQIENYFKDVRWK